LKSVKKYYRVDRCEIGFLKFIFEAYDGLAVITTIDTADGLILLYIAPGCEAVVEMILKDLSRDILIEPAMPSP
jgi:hypothetical protein